LPLVDGRTYLGLEPTEDPAHWRLPVVPRLTSGRGALWGGIGLAAAAEAMEASTGRPTVWATAQYLAFAPPPAVVDLEVHLPVTGHFTSQSRVVGRVDGEEIFTVNAAMGERPTRYRGQWAEFPSVPPPDECPRREDFRYDTADTLMGYVDLRLARERPTSEVLGTPGDGRSALWARVPDLDLSTTTLAIVGDLVGFGVSQALGERAHGSSLDNTLRIVDLVPTEWVLLDIRVDGVAHGFGHGLVHLWTPDGHLLGTASQSTIVRP
jgi:acyl-CoA thioesterase